MWRDTSKFDYGWWSISYFTWNMEKSNNNVHKGIILMWLLWDLFQIVTGLIVGTICLTAIYVLLFEDLG
tara:strand:+ start:121 stop:327 length:207 start_codon:yes stop_codon:yes gene_type:complete